MFGVFVFVKTCFILRLCCASFPADLINDHTAWRQSLDTTTSQTLSGSWHLPPHEWNSYRRSAIFRCTDMSAKWMQKHQPLGFTGSSELCATGNLNFPATLRNMLGGGARTTEPYGLLISLGPGTNEPGAAHPASFGDRLEPPARPPASGLRERGPGRPPRTSRDRDHRRRRPAAAGQDAGPEGRPVGRRPTERARPGRRPQLPEDVVRLHAPVLVARAHHRHPQRRRRHSGGRTDCDAAAPGLPASGGASARAIWRLRRPEVMTPRRRRRRRTASGRAARACARRLVAYSRRPTAPRHGRREVPPPGAEPAASAPLLPGCAAEARAPHRGRPRSGAPRWHPTSQNPAAVAGSDAKASRRRPRRLERTAVVDKSDALGPRRPARQPESFECAFCVLGGDGFSLLRSGPSCRARPTLRSLSASPREAPPLQSETPRCFRSSLLPASRPQARSNVSTPLSSKPCKV